MSSPLTAEIEAKMPIPLANLFSIETGEYAGKIGRIVAPLCYRAYGLRVLGDHGHLRVTCATMAELSKLAEDSGLKVKYI